MFADDTKIWTKIVSKEDSGKLQEDLDNLSNGQRSGYYSSTVQPREMCGNW